METFAEDGHSLKILKEGSVNENCVLDGILVSPDSIDDHRLSFRQRDSLNLQSPISVHSQSLNDSFQSTNTPIRKRNREEDISPVKSTRKNNI